MYNGIAKKALAAVRRTMRSLEDFFFPMNCVSCGRAVSNADDCVCGDCIESITPLLNACSICSGEMIEGRCAICADRMWYLDGNTALAEYSGPMKAILGAYKFGKRRGIHRHLGELAYQVFKKKGFDVDIITAVPMSSIKMRKRGFNQSELAAKYVSRNARIKYGRLLAERPSSGTQRELRYRDRFLNVLDRYIPKGERLDGRSVLLVDDVFTTGATINECARLLKSRGAAKVHVITFARRTV